jgi:hypothetical protein
MVTVEVVKPLWGISRQVILVRSASAKGHLDPTDISSWVVTRILVTVHACYTNGPCGVNLKENPVHC